MTCRISYPSEFVERVRSEYADRPDVVFATETGRYGLGSLLSRGALMEMSPEMIVTSIEAGDLESVMKDAERAVRRRSLHAEWMRIAVRSISAIVAEPPAPVCRDGASDPPFRPRSIQAAADA